MDTGPLAKGNLIAFYEVRVQITTETNKNSVASARAKLRPLHMLVRFDSTESNNPLVRLGSIR